MSDLDGNPDDSFSRVTAQILNVNEKNNKEKQKRKQNKKKKT